jgi:hypothetical protein
MGDIIGMLCEIITRHRFGAWVQVDDLYSAQSRVRLLFERAQCRWCRQWYVRPMPSPWKWTEETDK